MKGDDEAAEKSHEATPKKLEDARRKGEVPRSADLITAGAYLGLLIAGLAAGAGSLMAAGEALAGYLGRADGIAAAVGDGGTGTALVLSGLLAELARALLPWFLLPLACAALSLAAQQAFTVTGSKLQPKLSRISLLSNAKNKFGRNGLFEFAKSAVKLLIYGAILSIFLWHWLPRIVGAVALSPGAVAILLGELSLRFLGLVVLIALSLGAIDFLWQRAEHLRSHRMSRKEVTDEQKESEGDPHFKQARRQKGHDIATNTMLRDVPDASVVIVNPTHYAVALKWSRATQGAPVCVAKGVDVVAARIREAATEAGVPIHSDPPTARALHAGTEIGQEVEPDHYAAVAIAIRFAEDMRRKARAR